MRLSFWPNLGLDLSSANGILKLIMTQQCTPVHTLCPGNRWSRTNIHRKSEEAARADKQTLLYRKLHNIKRLRNDEGLVVLLSRYLLILTSEFI